MQESVRGGWLDGLRILDLSEGIAGPFCAKLLADLGADVVKVEPLEGDLSRRLGPYPGDVPDPERSASFFYFNTSKRGVTLDLDTAAGRAELERLVRRFDVIIAGETIEQLTARGLGYEQLCAWNPHVILTTVSGFGSFGPHSDFASSHLVACAMGGWAQLCGVPEREPLQAGGAITETLAGAFAAVATSLAAFGRRRHGQGEHVDVSVQEAVLAGAQIPTLIYEYRGLVPARYSSVGSGAGAAYILPTRKGYIGLNALTLPQWRMLCAFLGREDIADDPRYEGISWALPDARLEEIRGAFQAALSERTAEELFHEAEACRVPFGLVPDPAGLLALAPHRERGFFVELEHPAAGRVAVPGVPLHASVDVPAPRRPPLLGEHNATLLGAADADDGVAAEPAAPPLPGGQPLPLEGVRIVDLSMFFAGPVAAQIAADAGADVVKVESVQRIDGWRGSGTPVEGPAPSWESSPYFNWVNRNKRDITLNLTDARGAAVVKELVRTADVLIENYTPRVMERFGLGYDVLAAINPQLVMISLSGFGAGVSWRDYVAFGMSTEQMSGVAHLTGYEDDVPLFTGMTGGDLFSGVIGANAILAALHRREATGAGLHIDLSQIEACNLFIGDVMTGFSLAGHDPGRTGNAHPVHAPQGIYPCRDGRWIGITCRSDAEWVALCALGGLGPLDDELATSAARQAQRHEIDARIRDFTTTREAVALMHELQALGVAAGVVQDGPALLADPQLAARGSFIAQDRPGLGVKRYPNQPYRFRNAQPPPTRRAPLLGEHLEEVLLEEVGLSSEALADLVIDDVVGTVPVAAR